MRNLRPANHASTDPMNTPHKTPWIAKKTLDDGNVPILPYTRHHFKENTYRPWDYTYDIANDQFICPRHGILRHGILRHGILRHTTTDKEGKRIYRSIPKHCVNCPAKCLCNANENGRKVFSTHIWQEYLDIVEQLRKTERGKALYRQRKETIERFFADAKEKHAMRYTHHRGLTRVTNWVRLKYAAMNLKKLANWSWNNSFFYTIWLLFRPDMGKTICLA